MKKDSSIFCNNLKKIAFLCESIHDSYTIDMWRGIREEALKRNINVLCFVGGYLEKSAYDSWEFQRNTLYRLLNSRTIDGIIINGNLPTFSSPSILDSLKSQWGDVPVIAVGPKVEKISSICIDNKSGMRALINHLIETHNYKKFAFIKGPETNPESNDRFEAFLEILNKHNITHDPQLVINGTFDKPSGFQAAEKLIGFKKGIEVIVAADDSMAVGALEYLTQEGIKVPQEIAITGFDNVDESMFATPPVTTVCQSMSELGAVAVESLCDYFDGKQFPPHVDKPSKLLVRRSCGCFLEFTSDMLPETVDFFEEDCLSIAEKIKEFQEKSSEWSDTVEFDSLIEILADFRKSVTEEKPDMFLFTLERVLCDQLQSDYAIALWSNTLNLIKESALASSKSSQIGAIVHDITNKAASLLALCASRTQGRHRIKLLDHTASIRDTANEVLNVLELDKLLETISDTFPETGVKSGSVCLYEPYGQTENVKLSLAFMNGKSKDISGFKPFPTKDFLPPGTLGGEDAQAIIVASLFFRENLFGYITMHDGAFEYSSYEKLAEYISTSLNSMKLINEIERQKTHLEIAHKDLKIMQEKEHEYLETITRELETGRKIQKSFLPSLLPKLDEWKIDAAFIPSAQISGDFYDVFMLNENKLFVAIGDVCGKNVGAALLMALIRTLVRVIVGRSEDPLSAVSTINDYILEHHSNSIVGQMFVTLFVGCIDIKSGVIEYINAGHLYPLIINKAADVRELKTSGPAIGLAPNITFDKHHSSIGKNELLFMYTDGVTDARNESDILFEKEAMMSVLLDPNNSVNEKISLIISKLRSHSNSESLFDDVTMLGLERM
ncbi:Serine phosphatase RsbU [Chitinispirillum alkaliphilum]|nr:Serine phosphatase RsbU [Chitinispirillum alkaliphilum]